MDPDLTIPPWAHRTEDKPAVKLSRWLTGRTSEEEEQFRVLCSHIRYKMLGMMPPGRVIAVTSSVPEEGKTTCSVNLAASLARDFHRRVLLIEADLRRPVITDAHRGLEGLVQCVDRDGSLEAALCDTPIPELQVLLCGKSQADRSVTYLGSPLLRREIPQLRERYEFIIVDCPPILPFADIRIISEWVDHLLVVIRAESTDRTIVERAVSSLDRNKILGAVLNGTREPTGHFAYSLPY